MQQEKREVIKSRLQIYDFFANSFLQQPSNDLVATLKAERDFFHSLLDEDISQPNFGNLKDLTQRYYDRFFVPTSGFYVPPYESSIRNRRYEDGEINYGNLNGPEAQHVKACYEAVDFSPGEIDMFNPLKDINLPDHLGFELAFLSYLSALEAKALDDEETTAADKWRKLQRQFLEEHLICWIDDYAVLSNQQGSDLYSYLSKLASGWIKNDLNFLTNSY